jgi:Sulfotransferase family
MNPAPPLPETSPFYVPAILDLLGGWVHRHRPFWLWLGRLESRVLRHELRTVSIAMPIYVCGLARSGSTLLHEIVAAHPGVATHRVKDYPFVYIPHWWRRAVPTRAALPRERAHQDGIRITPNSPDALEEMLWMAFFPSCHDPAVSGRLGADERHPAFEEFYCAHIRKLLLAEHANRYVAKANYHTARLAYLVRVFPDAKVLVPVREPVGHLASLVRQHRHFSEGQRASPRALAYMQRSGHFEFGLDRRPMHLGEDSAIRTVLTAWATGEEVRGWARYWSLVHDHLAELLECDERVRAASLIVRFEALCDQPTETIRSVLAHCQLPDAEPIVARFAPTIRVPDYYAPPFSPEDLAVIHEETRESAARWEY